MGVYVDVPGVQGEDAMYCQFVTTVGSDRHLFGTVKASPCLATILPCCDMQVRAVISTLCSGKMPCSDYFRTSNRSGIALAHMTSRCRHARFIIARLAA